MLKTQIAQQANSSTTPPARLLRSPNRTLGNNKQNSREQYNAIVLRNCTQLEGPKVAGDEVESEKEYDNGVAPLPNKN